MQGRRRFGQRVGEGDIAAKGKQRRIVEAAFDERVEIMVPVLCASGNIHGKVERLQTSEQRGMEGDSHQPICPQAERDARFCHDCAARSPFAFTRDLSPHAQDEVGVDAA